MFAIQAILDKVECSAAEYQGGRAVVETLSKHVDECDIYTALIKTAMHIVAVHFMGIIHFFFFYQFSIPV